MIRGLCIGALLVCLAAPTLAQTTAVPPQMNFQGRLAKPDGTPIPDGNVNLGLSLFNALTGGTLLWQRNLSNVPVKNGIVSVRLDFTGGFQNGTTLASLFGGAGAFLEIRINNGAPLTPRQQLLSVAYAFKADSVKDGSITSASIANGTITAADLAPNIFNALGWSLTGNSGTNPATNFLGTTDNKPLNFRVNNQRALRLESATTTIGSSTVTGVNVLGGNVGNSLSAGAVGATIAGGGIRFGENDLFNRVTDIAGTIGGGGNNTAGNNNATMDDASFATVAGGSRNQASNSAAFVGGGVGNTASGVDATIGGGGGNTADGRFATVGGGNSNRASGTSATVPGGEANLASGNFSFAAGQRAFAQHDGTFVWGDSQSVFTSSSAPNQFLVRAAYVGVNRTSPVTSSDVFSVRSPKTTGFGGMYVDTQGTSAQPFYGYALAGEERAWHFVDGSDGNKWKLNVGGDHLTVTPTGNMGIGTTNPSSKLDVAGNIRAISLTQTSDAHFKTNVATIENPLDSILRLRGVTFDWKQEEFGDKNFPTGRQIGFIAQEVEKVLPELVRTDKGGYKSVAYQNVVPVLVEAIRTLKKENDILKAENDTIKARLGTVEMQQTQIEALQRRLDAMQRQR
jgi:hypothetical protein